MVHILLDLQIGSYSRKHPCYFTYVSDKLCCASGSKVEEDEEYEVPHYVVLRGFGVGAENATDHCTLACVYLIGAASRIGLSTSITQTLTSSQNPSIISLGSKPSHPPS